MNSGAGEAELNAPIKYQESKELMSRLTTIDFESAYKNWKNLARYTNGEDQIILDLGQDSLSALYSKIGKEGEITVLDYASAYNTGYSNGAISDQSQFVHTMDRVVGVLRKRNKLRLKNLDIVFSAPFISSYSHFATVNLPPNRRVTLKVVEEAINSSRNEISSLVEHVVQVVPVRFALDTYYSGNEPPLGMEGEQLGIEMLFIMAPSASMRQIEKVLKECGYSAKDWWYAGISAAESVVVPRSEAGVAVVDIGGGSTDIAVYQHGRLLQVSVVDRGGKDIDSDLAIYLNESLKMAEEVKRNFGCTMPEIVAYNEVIDLRKQGYATDKMVSVQGIAAVIKSRAQEILFLVNQEIGKALSPNQLSKIIFTGGMAKIPGFIDLAEELLDRKVTLGTPGAIDGVTMGFTDQRCAALIGTLGILRNKKIMQKKLAQTAMTRVQKLSSWFKALTSTRVVEQGELK